MPDLDQERIPPQKTERWRTRERTLRILQSVPNPEEVLALTPGAGDDEDRTRDKFEGAVSTAIRTLTARQAVSFESIEALRAANFAGIPDGAIIGVAGYYAPGDGGGGFFYLDRSDTTSEDDGGFVLVLDSGLRVFRLAEYSCPRFFGAVGNFEATVNPSGADDTEAFQAALDCSYEKGIPFRVSTKGNYRITGTLVVPDGFPTTIDFGGSALGETGATMYVDALDTPFLRLIDVNGLVLTNLGVYFKPANGWGLSDASSQPQQTANAYVLDCVGWLTFCRIRSVKSFYGSGFLRNRIDPSLTTRTEARVFNCEISTVQVRYGYIGVDLEAGSGSSWDNVYLLSSPGGTFTQSAVSALRVSSFIDNEMMSRWNVEWSRFSGPMFDLTGADVVFDGLHVEGVRPAYSGSSSVKNLIEVTNGKLVLRLATFMDIYPEWGLMTRLNVLSVSGNGETSVTLDDVRFRLIFPSVGYEIHRYDDSSGGAWRLFVNNVNDEEVQWAATSPTWVGVSDLMETPSRLELSEHFHGLPTASKAGLFEVFTNGTPPALAEGSVSAVSGRRPGLLKVSSGVTDSMATLLQVPAIARTASGALRFRVGFSIDTLPSGTSEYFRLAIGFSGNSRSAPQNTAANFVGFYVDFGSYGHNRVMLRTISSSSSTSATLVSSPVAGTFYDLELVVNARGDQVRGYLGTRRSSGATANIFTNIPASSVDLYPQIQVIRRGATAATSFPITFDYAQVSINPNGIA